MTFRIEGDVNVEKFESAWRNTIAVSDALCIRLFSNNSITMQGIGYRHIPLHLADLSTEVDPESSLNSWLVQDLKTPTNMFGPLAGSILIKLSDTSWVWYCKLHHIITDAASYKSIWQNMISFYDSTDHNPKRVAEPYQLFCQELTQSYDKPDSSKSGNYWKTLDIPPAPSYYGNRPSYTDTKSARIDNFFSDAHRRQLALFADQPGIKSFNKNIAYFQVLLANLFIVLHRISHQSELSIATTIPNRSDKRFTSTPGLFVELLPLTISIDSEDTFDTILAKVKTSYFELIKFTEPGASTRRSFRDVSAVINFVPFEIEPLGGLPVNTEWHHPGHMDRQHALRLHITDWSGSGKLRLDFECNQSCFNNTQMQSLKEHYLTLISAFMHNKDQRILSVPLEKDPARLVSVGNTANKPVDAQPVTDLTALFENVALSNPDRFAVSDESSELSYQATLELITNLSDQLKTYRSNKGLRIAVLLPRSIAVPVALFAVLKAGGTFIPLDPDTPADRIAYLFDVAKVDGAVTTQTLASELPTDGTAFTILLDELGRINESPEHRNQKHSSPSEDQRVESISAAPAYILFTSGSTGKPKGVEVSRSALANYCLWAAKYYGGGTSITMPFFTRLGFDLTITSLFVPWLTGGQIRVYKPLSDSVDYCLPKILQDDQVDIIKLTPSHLTMMANQDLSKSRVSQLIVGGEDFKVSLASQVHESFGGEIIIHNEYGPTEATVGCIVHIYNPELDVAGSVPIGKPVAGMQAVVLNECQQIQPLGVSGTLWVAGPSLANGYLTQSTVHNESFQVLDHLGNDRFYRTGDQVKLSDDGIFNYLGRNDDQHKIRGARVELTEIEEIALSSTPVNQCVAVVQNDTNKSSEAPAFYCESCGLSSNYPGLTFDNKNVCSLCNEFESYKQNAEIYFKSYPELEALAESLKNQDVSAPYDCMVLLSGGKDSTYALARLSDLGLRILAYTLDNGYLSSEAKENIKRVCDSLGIDHEFGKTPAMREIFADSLSKYSNVCNGCFKTIYTLSLNRAEQLGINAIFTGLSRGQFFETRLTKELFLGEAITSEKIDATVHQARIAYHQTPDAVTRNLDTAHLKDSTIFQRIQFHDFYRYCDVDLDELYDYLATRLPWIRPSDTGRSTNCMINDVGIYVHKIERGFHNYSLPYSWDVRLGHKNRDDAMEELNDSIDLKQVNQILDEIDYQPRTDLTSTSRLVLYYTADASIPTHQIKQQLSASLPPWMVPNLFMQVDNIPMSKNGKIDRNALPMIEKVRNSRLTEPVPPSNPIEQIVHDLWKEELKIDQIGMHDNFFELGGDSLAGIRITAKLNNQGFSLSNTTIFENQTIAQLANCDELKTQQADSNQTQESVKPFASVSQNNLSKLAGLLNKQTSATSGDQS